MVIGYPGHEGGKHVRKDTPVASSPVEPVTVEQTPQTKGGNMLGNLLGENAKAIVSFAVTFGAQILARTFDGGGSPILPDDWKGWLSLIGGSLLAAALVWAKSNTESVATLQRKLDAAAAKG
jgi:hypothetical protein